MTNPALLAALSLILAAILWRTSNLDRPPKVRVGIPANARNRKRRWVW